MFLEIHTKKMIIVLVGRQYKELRHKRGGL